MSDWKQRLGIVYSTNQQFEYNTGDVPLSETLPPNDQQLRIRIERKGRAGKTVTIVSNFVGKTEDLTDLAKILKTKCGVGGSVKDGEIIIQGDFRERIVSLLKAIGYSRTKG